LKFVSSQSTNNMFEGVYNFDGILLTAENDPVNCGTYNYCSDQINSELHQKFDIDTYFKWGNVKGLFYGNSTDERDYNGNKYKNNANQDIYDKYWRKVLN